MDNAYRMVWEVSFAAVKLVLRAVLAISVIINHLLLTLFFVVVVCYLFFNVNLTLKPWTIQHSHRFHRSFRPLFRPSTRTIQIKRPIRAALIRARTAVNVDRTATRSCAFVHLNTAVNYATQLFRRRQ